jgi:alpha,alpha-trehalase
MTEAWVFAYDRYDPSIEMLREALCTLGNGYFATRGAAPESSADGIHYPGTYLAGGYNRLKTVIEGHVVENEDLVNMPNWLPLTFSVEGGDWLNLDNTQVLSFHQELNLKQGILRRGLRLRDAAGRITRLEEKRLVSMADVHLAALAQTIVPENWSGRLTVRAALDGGVTNAGVARYRGLNSHHLVPLEAEVFDERYLYLRARTTQSELLVAEAARFDVSVNGEEPAEERRAFREGAYIAQELDLDVREGDEIRVEKVVSLYSSRDHAIADCGLEARDAVRGAPGFADLARRHSTVWKRLWRYFNIDVELYPPEDSTHFLTILRLHIFHLLQTSSYATIDLDVGVPARGWHGEAYRGHIFWDEVFIFPLLNLRIPEITRALLLYRYRRLPQARRAACEAGLPGAMYPWQSGSNGREETQELHLNPKSGNWIPDRSHRQRHVNAAIAYEVWQYYQASRDAEFLSIYGAEMFLEIARFWAGMATKNEETGRYEILGVMGPDEYHDGYPGAEEGGLNNNAYSNVMAAWILARAFEILDLLSGDRKVELLESLSIDGAELVRWKDVSEKLVIPFHDDGIISQFEGYEDLEEFDWDGYRDKYDDIQRLDRILEAEGDTPNRYKASKQADVLMLLFLFSAEELRDTFEQLGYDLPPEAIPRNIEYYMKRTSHGSTLSRVVHSWVLARSDRETSWKFFQSALESDVADVQGGTTKEGIHLGAMAGTVDLLQRCFAGLETREDVLWLNPLLPDPVKRLSMSLHYRGHSLCFTFTDIDIRVRALRCSERPVSIGFREHAYSLHSGEELVLHL